MSKQFYCDGCGKKIANAVEGACLDVRVSVGVHGVPDTYVSDLCANCITTLKMYVQPNSWPRIRDTEISYGKTTYDKDD